MMNTENTRRALRTELVFILDRSGSMAGLESDTIGGYNSLLNKQKKEAGECRLTTVLFDDEYELLHDRADLKAVAPITEDEYDAVLSWMYLNDIEGFSQESTSSDTHFIPDF